MKMGKCLLLLCISTPLVLCQRNFAAKDLPAPFTYSSEELDNWDAPAKVRKSFPYYLAGFDKIGRPVIVAEISKWDVKGLVSNPETEPFLRRAQEQFFYRVAGNSSWADGITNGFVLIADTEDFDIQQISRLSAVRAWTRGTQLLESLWDPEKSDVIVINTNRIFETLLGLIQPFTNRIIQDLEVFGTDKNKWVPRLLRDIPESQLPSWLGGSPDWQPVKSN